MTILDPHTAARRVYEHAPIGQSVTLERRQVPVENFGEFVRECKGFGLCILDYRINKQVTVLRV